MSKKFDVVIGNPPYQEDRLGTRAKPIYPYFMDSAYDIADKVTLVTPGRFLFNAGDTSKEWNEKMLKDEHLKVIHYENLSSKVFTNTDIKGGVAITYRDPSKTLGPIDIFIPHKELDSILDKVSRNESFKSLSDIVFTAQGYKLSEKFHEENPEESSELPNKSLVTTNIFQKFPHLFKKNISSNERDDYIGMYGRQNNERVYRWVRKDYINVVENFNKYKVFLPKSNGSGAIGEVLSTPLIGAPLIGHTQTFMSIGSFNHQSEANACMKYIKSKFARSLLGILKITQDNPPRVWKKIPLQDFTSDSDIDWSKSIAEIDEQLYKKYNLNEDEIEFIETNVKEME